MPKPTAKKTVSRTRQSRNLKDRSQSVADITRRSSMALYGRSGSGKTTLACTAPGALLINIRDDGDDSVRDVKGLRVWEVEELEDFEDAYWFLKEGDHKYKTAILDTVTMLQQTKIEDVIGGKQVRGGKNAGDWGTMTKQDWGEVSAYMKYWITNFRDLDMNVIFLAQERVFNIDDDGGSEIGMIDPEIGPSLSPATKNHLNAAVNIIGNTFIRSRIIKKKDEKGRVREKEKIEYCLGVGPSSMFTRKIRKPRSIELPDVIVDPTFEDIMELIEGE